MKTIRQIIRKSMDSIVTARLRRQSPTRYVPACSPLETKVSLSQVAGTRTALDAAPLAGNAPAIVSIRQPSVAVFYQSEHAAPLDAGAPDSGARRVIAAPVPAAITAGTVLSEDDSGTIEVKDKINVDS